jgi:Leucine-rich repeat (LRR) protein
LQELPTSIGQLNALQNLHLWGCPKLQELPTSIGQLNVVQNLDLWGCPKLQELPTSIGQLSALQNHSYDIHGARMLWKLKEARILTNFIDQPV